jgi:ArsR family transcriptional regulator, arsenate/arsenite/antimonite-responsive transcriptional repressor
MTQVVRSIEKDQFFAAFADRTRLRLLNLMGDAEVCVCYFIEILGSPQPTISRHLAYLRRVGVVAARREATWVHYRIVRPTDPAAAAVLDSVLTWLAADPEMKADRTKLEQVCCAPQLPVQLRGAPRPLQNATPR